MPPNLFSPRRDRDFTADDQADPFFGTSTGGAGTATAPRSPSFLQGFEEDKGGRLAGVLGEELIPELDESKKRRSRIEDIFFKTLDPRNQEESINRGAERIALDVLRPGGEVTEAIRSARGQSINSGFGTQGGDLSRQEATIVSEGLRSSVGRFVGEALPELSEGAANRAAQGAALSREEVIRLIESLFTGVAGAESLKLANDDGGFLGIF